MCFSGGALKKETIFAMGIVPYINASIIMQLLTFAIPQWQELAKEGESGRKRIAQYTRYLTMALALAQAIGLTMYLRQGGALTGGLPMTAEVILTMIAGTAFLMWLGEQITDKGIGNGVSLIIFCGIMVRLPTQVLSVAALVGSGAVKPWQVLVLIVAFFVTVVGVIFVTLGQRKIPIQHVRKIVGNKMSQGGTSYLPFRVASAGVIPIIFALSIQLLPATFAQFVPPKIRTGHLSAQGDQLAVTGLQPDHGLGLCGDHRVLHVFLYGRHDECRADRGRPEEVRLVYSRHPARQADDGVPGQSDDPHHPGGSAVPGLYRSAAILDSGADRDGGATALR